MSEDMQQDAIDAATESPAKFHIEGDIAVFIKKESLNPHAYGTACIIGRDFGS